MHRKVAVIGLWHQGVVAAACLADAGCDVAAMDPDEAVVAKLSTGQAPLFEPGLDELLQKNLATRHLRFTSDMADAVGGRPLVMVMFDTPVDEDDQSDIRGVFTAARLFAPHLAPDAIVLVTAQVPVGTCDALAATIREVNPAARFAVAYSPENLRLGAALEMFRKPALPVFGSDDDRALDRLEEFFSFLGVRWQRVSLRTAEMVKHGLNAFLATTITFGNELGNLCDAVGADGKRLAEVLRLEPRVGSKALLLPGLGFSGGTIARDMQTLRQLGREHHLPTLLLDGVWEANRRQNEMVVQMLRMALGELRGRQVTILGLTYKPDTSTLRRSASLEVIRELGGLGAVVRAHDPKADRVEVQRHRGFEFFDDVYAALHGAEAVILMTPWRMYRELDFERAGRLMASKIIIDPGNSLDPEALSRAGFTCIGLGRGGRSKK